VTTDTAVFIVEGGAMSDPAPPPRARELPTTTLQLAGHASESVVQGLSGRSPWMLGIIVLNFVGIAAAIFFLNLLIQGQQAHLANLLTLQQRNQDQLLEMHRLEFNSLLELSNKTGVPITPLPPPTPVTPLPQGQRR
jgi:hypothetical protein